MLPHISDHPTSNVIAFPVHRVRRRRPPGAALAIGDLVEVIGGLRDGELGTLSGFDRAGRALVQVRHAQLMVPATRLRRLCAVDVLP